MVSAPISLSTNIETAVDLPGLITTIEVTDSIKVIMHVPATTAQMTISEATYVFSAITDIVTKDGETYYCGTNTETTFEVGANNSPCVMCVLFTVILPSSAPSIYLHGDGPTTPFALEGVRTSLASEQTFTTQGDLLYLEYPLQQAGGRCLVAISLPLVERLSYSNCQIADWPFSY